MYTARRTISKDHDTIPRKALPAIHHCSASRRAAGCFAFSRAYGASESGDWTARVTYSGRTPDAAFEDVVCAHDVVNDMLWECFRRGIRFFSMSVCACSSQI